MDNYVAPEISEYARQIVKNAIGTQTKIDSVEWSAGGLFNKVNYIHTTEGCFILKIECDKIFLSTRKEQIENEVFGNKLFQKAGIPCASVLAYDFTKNDIGVRYVFTERISNDILWLEFNQFDEAKKSEIQYQVTEIFAKMRTITNSYFGSLLPSGILGRYETWDGYYHSIFNLLIHDSECIGIFTDEELDIVKKAAEKPLTYTKEYVPSLVHGDFGEHNAIWGNTNGGQDKLHIIDFGNANYGLPCLDEYMVRKHGGFKCPPYDIADHMNLDKELYENLLNDFERMWWKETEKRTEDYAHCLNWMASSIEASKKDTSRNHINDFVGKCRKIL